MTKIAIVPNAAGTGTFTIEAPNSNSNRTLVLPDAAGELLTDVSSLPAANLTGDVAAARITTALNAGGSAPIYACRAWVNFDGDTGSGNTIRGSGNVSSVTRNATGDYTVNFMTAMPDANYAVMANSGQDPSASSTNRAVGADRTGADVLASSCRIYSIRSSGVKENQAFVAFSVFR
jgi:hypothetical protein